MDKDRPAGSMFSGSNLIVSGGTYNVHNSSDYNVEKGAEQQFCFHEAERIWAKQENIMSDCWEM